MFKNLNAGAIGISNKSLAETIVLAKKTGFAGIDFNIREAATIADEHGVDYVRSLFVENNVLPGLVGTARRLEPGPVAGRSCRSAKACRSRRRVGL